MQRGRERWGELQVSPVSDSHKPSLAFPLSGHRCGSTEEGGFQVATCVRAQGGKKGKGEQEHLSVMNGFLAEFLGRGAEFDQFCHD